MAQKQELPLEEYHRAGLEITNGNPEVYKWLYSRRDDVTLANPFGPPARGWIQVSETLDGAAAKYRDGEVVGFENVSTVVTPDLAYTVEIESFRVRVRERTRSSPFRFGSLRSFDARTASGRCAQARRPDYHAASGGVRDRGVATRRR